MNSHLLSVGNKERIIDVLAERAFGEKQRTLLAKRLEKVDELVQAAWGDDFDAMKRITERLGGNAGNRYFHLCDGFHATYPVPVGHKLNRLFPELYEELAQVCGDLDRAQNEDRDLRRTLRGVLKPLRTYKQLYKIWPELEELRAQIGDCAEPSSTSKALAVQVDALNKVLKLPTPKKIEVKTETVEAPNGKKLRVRKTA